MDPERKKLLFRKLRTYAKFTGKMSGVSVDALIKRQEEDQEKNLMNLQIEKGIAFEKFMSSIQRKVKTEADARMILQNVGEYEAVVKLFGKDTEIPAKLVLCKGMSLETFQVGQPIVKQNDPSNNKFYIIVKGSVSIVKANDTNVFQLAFDPSNGNTRGSIYQNIGQKQSRASQPSLVSIPEENGVGEQVQEDMESKKERFLEEEIAKHGKEVNQLFTGQGFGEAAIIESDPKRAKRGATILAREEDTHLIVIMKRDFQKFKDQFSSQGREKAQILSQLIPQLKLISSTQTKNDLIFYFQEDGGLRGKVLTVEDKIGDKIYVLKDGEVSIEKNYVNSKNIYYKDIQKLKIAMIGDYSFFGEELLLGSSDETSKYNYTISISSVQARFYSIKRSILMQKFPNIIRDILSEFQLKEKHRAETVEYILSKNAQPQNAIQVDETLHEYNKLRNQDLFLQMKHAMVESHNKKIFSEVISGKKVETQDSGSLSAKGDTSKRSGKKSQDIQQKSLQNGSIQSKLGDSETVFLTSQPTAAASADGKVGSLNGGIRLHRPASSAFFVGQQKASSNRKSQQVVFQNFQKKTQPQFDSDDDNNDDCDSIQDLTEGINSNKVRFSQSQQQILSSLSNGKASIESRRSFIQSSQMTASTQESLGSMTTSVTDRADRKSIKNNNYVINTYSALVLPPACDPVYSRKYQNQQTGSEVNFMDNIEEKLKAMSRMQTSSTQEINLDFGYLEQFKKKHLLKLQSPVTSMQKLLPGRGDLFQKKINEIKNKYTKSLTSLESLPDFDGNTNSITVTNTKNNTNVNTIVSNRNSAVSPIQFEAQQNQSGLLSARVTSMIGSDYFSALSPKNILTEGNDPASLLVSKGNMTNATTTVKSTNQLRLKSANQKPSGQVNKQRMSVSKLSIQQSNSVQFFMQQPPPPVKDVKDILSPRSLNQTSPSSNTLNTNQKGIGESPASRNSHNHHNNHPLLKAAAQIGSTTQLNAPPSSIRQDPYFSKQIIVSSSFLKQDGLLVNQASSSQLMSPYRSTASVKGIGGGEKKMHIEPFEEYGARLMGEAAAQLNRGNLVWSSGTISQGNSSEPMLKTNSSSPIKSREIKRVGTANSQLYSRNEERKKLKTGLTLYRIASE